jgi:hypothetical protein
MRIGRISQRTYSDRSVRSSGNLARLVWRVSVTQDLEWPPRLGLGPGCQVVHVLLPLLE